MKRERYMALSVRALTDLEEYCKMAGVVLQKEPIESRTDFPLEGSMCEI